MRTLLVTGAAGFIGSNFVRRVVALKRDDRIIAYDKLTYAGNLANLEGLIDNDRVTFIRGDICDAAAVQDAWDAHRVTDVVHFAAESHVDRSILSSGPFVQTNVVGTQVLLDVARHRGVGKFVHVSTDEVYGSLPEDRADLKFTEDTTLAPNSPYSASKAGSDCLVRSYFHTFGLPAVITRCGNNLGPFQFPEKLVPLFVTNLMEGKPVPLYGDGGNVRDWIHVEDHCDALLAVLDRGKAGEVYNIGGADGERTNRQVTETILREMGKAWDKYVTPVPDRPGHDRRYSIDATKIQTELGWQPRWGFAESIRATIEWYRSNEAWWRAVKVGAYLKFYEQQYGK